jgi:hypothetical protein
MRATLAAAVATAALAVATPAVAQQPDVAAQAAQAPSGDLEALKQDLARLKQEFATVRDGYGQRLSALEARIAALEGAKPSQAGAPTPREATPPQAAPPGAPQPPPPQAAPAPPQQQTAEVPPGAAAAGGPAGSLPVYGGPVASLSKVFNPDMAVIGDFLGSAGSNSVVPAKALELHEGEVAFQAIVDPYARADFFISFGEEGVSFEEGFITFPTLPGGLLLKVGKMRGAFGKVNTLHNHVLPWTDRPLVTDNLVGGEDGIDDSGISVARLVPNPWIFLEVTGQVFRGDSGVFQSHQRSDLTYLGHVRAYQDITESSNLDVGVSYSRGHNDAGPSFVTDLYGVDATFRWRPLRRSIYHSFVARSELIWSRRGQPDGVQPAFGYYVSGDYQFARRWFAGLRYDRSDRRDNALLRDTGQSVTLTYWPSEFSQIRGQYRRTRYVEATPANEFLFQFQFSIGAHGAHPF